MLLRINLAKLCKGDDVPSTRGRRGIFSLCNLGRKVICGSRYMWDNRSFFSFLFMIALDCRSLYNVVTSFKILL